MFTRGFIKKVDVSKVPADPSEKEGDLIQEIQLIVAKTKHSFQYFRRSPEKKIFC